MIPKFRAWDKECKEMGNVTKINYVGNWVASIPHVVLDTRCDLIPFENIILMQSTGFHDQKGNELFDGDIVIHTQKSINYGNTFNHSYCEIFKGKNGAFRVKGPHTYGLDAFSSRKRLEVVGNIYENSDLLSQNHWSTGGE